LPKLQRELKWIKITEIKQKRTFIYRDYSGLLAGPAQKTHRWKKEDKEWLFC